MSDVLMLFFFFQAEDGIRDGHVTGVQTCALPIWFLMVLLPDSVNGVFAQPLGLGHTSRAPVGGVGRRGVQGGVDDGLDLRSEERRVGKECRCGWWSEE